MKYGCTLSEITEQYKVFCVFTELRMLNRMLITCESRRLNKILRRNLSKSQCFFAAKMLLSDFEKFTFFLKQSDMDGETFSI